MQETITENLRDDRKCRIKKNMLNDTTRIKLGNPEKWGNSTGQNTVSSINKSHLKKYIEIFKNLRNILIKSNI